MECMKHYTQEIKGRNERPNSPLYHPVGQHIWPKAGGGRWSVEPHSGINYVDSAGLELIFFTLQLQPAWDKLCKLDNG